MVSAPIQLRTTRSTKRRIMSGTYRIWYAGYEGTNMIDVESCLRQSWGNRRGVMQKKSRPQIGRHTDWLRFVLRLNPA